MARTIEQNEAIREQTKLRIKEVALKIFSRNGIGATRIQDLAKEANISVGLMYRYYRSKEEIYFDLVEESLNNIVNATVYLEQLQLPINERIEFALKELFTILETNDTFRNRSLFIQQAINTTLFNEEQYSHLQALRDIPYQKMADIFKQGQEEGSIIDGDPTYLATLFWSNITGMAIYLATREAVPFTLDYQPIYQMFIKRKEDEHEY